MNIIDVTLRDGGFTCDFDWPIKFAQEYYELLSKLDEFATHNDNLDEIFENKEQIEVSKFYEKLPKPTLIAIKELLDDQLFIKSQNEE